MCPQSLVSAILKPKERPGVHLSPSQFVQRVVKAHSLPRLLELRCVLPFSVRLSAAQMSISEPPTPFDRGNMSVLRRPSCWTLKCSLLIQRLGCCDISSGGGNGWVFCNPGIWKPEVCTRSRKTVPLQSLKPTPPLLRCRYSFIHRRCNLSRGITVAGLLGRVADCHHCHYYFFHSLARLVLWGLMCQRESTLCKFSVGYMKDWLDLERWEAM